MYFLFFPGVFINKNSLDILFMMYHFFQKSIFLEGKACFPAKLFHINTVPMYF